MWTANRWKKSKRDNSTASHVYRGRFAPTTNGPLHAGSLLTALASYLDARHHDGYWHLRLDDLDGPRNDPEAPADIQRALEAHGLGWDGPILRQSERLDAYMAARESLERDGRLFYCTCSRRELRQYEHYPGTCRQRLQPPTTTDAAVRARVGHAALEFTDRICGPQRTRAGDDFGDFVLWRRDGIPGYQLATAVDDGAADLTHVVRGNDLLGDTPRQLLLMHWLHLSPPVYAHGPVLVDAAGAKLSKQAGAPGLNNERATDNLAAALEQLGLPIAADQGRWSVESQLDWAAANWEPTVTHAPDSTVWYHEKS